MKTIIWITACLACFVSGEYWQTDWQFYFKDSTKTTIALMVSDDTINWRQILIFRIDKKEVGKNIRWVTQ